MIQVKAHSSRLLYFKSALLQECDRSFGALQHGIFPRLDLNKRPLNFSFSAAEYSSEDVNVLKEEIKELFGFDEIVDLQQIHSNKVTSFPTNGHFEKEGDALITKKSRLGLLIKVADCQPVLFYAPKHHAVGIAHCGWRGAMCGILQNTLSHFYTELGISPQELFVSIGPSLGRCCAQFSSPYEELNPDFHQFISSDNKVDFWQASWHILKTYGVPSEQIEVWEECTACNNDLWFSHRKDRPPHKGAFGALIGLTNDESRS